VERHRKKKQILKKESLYKIYEGKKGEGGASLPPGRHHHDFFGKIDEEYKSHQKEEVLQQRKERGHDKERLVNLQRIRNCFLYVEKGLGKKNQRRKTKVHGEDLGAKKTRS